MVSLRAVAATPFDFLSALTPRDRSWWRVLIMAGVAPAACFLVTVPLVALLLAWSGDDLFEAAGGPRLRQSAIFTIQVASGLAALAAGVLLSARFVFHRRLATWVTAAPRFRWKLLFWAAGFTCAGVGVLMAVDALLGGRPQLPLLDPVPPGVKFAYVVSVLGAFLAAAWAEEVVFRGYLLQQIGAFTHRSWLAIALSSIAFALIHLEFDPAALVARTLAGAAFAWAALRLGGLEFAIGSHLATNLMIALVQAPMLPNDPPFTGGLQDAGLQAALAAYVVIGAEIAARRQGSAGGAPTSSPA